MSLYPRARFLTSADRLPQLPPDEGAEVAFAGRSNAGKSSAINAIVERRALARSSRTPGRTQLINLFELEPGLRLADLPGYGYAKVPAGMQRHWQDLVGSYLQERDSLRGLFLVADVRRGVGPDELSVLEWALHKGLKSVVLLSKADKLSRSQGLRALQEARKRLPEAVFVQLFSAHDRQGVETARERLREMAVSG